MEKGFFPDAEYKDKKDFQLNRAINAWYLHKSRNMVFAGVGLGFLQL